eukprot:GSMAST32.ASY1.ANO1.613.1 assembled CDS
MSVKDLRQKLTQHCVDHTKCIEKSELVKALLVSVTLRAYKRNDGWVRTFVSKTTEGKKVASDINCTMDWIPANQAEIRLNIPGLNINFQELRAATSLPFRRKLQWFRQQVGRMGVSWAAGHVKVRVRRTHLLQDSYDAFRKLKPIDFRKIFQFEFIGEPALDAGGVAREWFALLGQSIFNVDFGLFKYGDVDNLCYQINPNSGRLIGKSLFDQQIIPAHLSLPLYKHMLASLTQILKSDDVADLMLDFCTTVESFGEINEIELKSGGGDLDVTNANRYEYVELMLKHIMLSQTKDQLSHLLIGFYEVIPEALVMIFDYQELELLICGLPHIDTEDWQNSSVYRGEMNEEKRARLLQFATGTSRVPVQGFKSLQSNQGKGPAFPVAHTCFNRIDLPEYKSLEELKKYLMIAIQMEATGFGLE